MSSSQGFIAVYRIGEEIEQLSDKYYSERHYYWQWKNEINGDVVQLTNTQPPPYTPAQWGSVDGWDVKETENKTVWVSTLPSTVFCSTEGLDYVLSKSSPKLCNKGESVKKTQMSMIHCTPL